MNPPAEIRDPVSRVRQSFAMRGESLVVDNWMEPGGVLPPHYHPLQEERWSVLDGEVRFRHGDGERVIGPDAGEIVVAPGALDRVARGSVYVVRKGHARVASHHPRRPRRDAERQRARRRAAQRQPS